jgi:putative membrane protein insertion efficiency factor
MPNKKLPIERGLQRVVLFLIRAYQVSIRSLMFNHCRFHPSCSEYAIEAIEVHGVLKGGSLTIARLLHCHPWHPGGFDPVPTGERNGFIDHEGQTG